MKLGIGPAVAVLQEWGLLVRMSHEEERREEGMRDRKERRRRGRRRSRNKEGMDVKYELVVQACIAEKKGFSFACCCQQPVLISLSVSG